MPLCPISLVPAAKVKSEGHHQVDQGAQRDARRALSEPGLGVVVPSGAGDVEVNQGSIAGKLAYEPCAGDRAAPLAAADILDIGETALDELPILIVHG